jgi:hypothetical protein
VTKHVEREKKKKQKQRIKQEDNPNSRKVYLGIQEKYIWECDYDYFLKYFLLRNILK